MTKPRTISRAERDELQSLLDSARALESIFGTLCARAEAITGESGPNNCAFDALANGHAFMGRPATTANDLLKTLGIKVRR